MLIKLTCYVDENCVLVGVESEAGGRAAQAAARPRENASAGRRPGLSRAQEVSGRSGRTH